jgi:uncharacterized zinc-type alcohol dehydrogenase-like protein
LSLLAASGIGVKLAHAMGAHTVLFTTSPSKVADGGCLGASRVVLSNDAGQMATHQGSFDLIINTVAAAHDPGPYLNLLKREGTLVMVGAPADPLPVAPRC